MGLLMKMIADKVLSPEEKENSAASIAMGAANIALAASIGASMAGHMTGGMEHAAESVAVAAASTPAPERSAPSAGQTRTA